MSYHASTRGLAFIGIPDDDAHIKCDDCGVRRNVRKPSGMPYAWLLDNKPAPGWRLQLDQEGLRRDFCTQCKEKER